MNEFFATMADVQRIVGILDEADDLYPAADGQEKSVEASRRRLARMIGLDAEDGTDGAWEWLAHGFAEEQLRKSIDIANVAFLPKPFSVNQLAQAARDTMAMQPAAE